MSVNATSDEALAGQLWGEDKYWDAERAQYVPNGGKYDSRRASTVEGGESPSVGTSSPASSDSTGTSADSKNSAPPSSVPTTEPSSSPDLTASFIAGLTGGSGTASQSPGD